MSKTKSKPTPGKRDPAVIARLQGKLLAFVRTHPGLRVEQINEVLKTETKDLALPIRKLITARAIRAKGTRRATTYFASGKVASSPKMSPKPLPKQQSKNKKKAAPAKVPPKPRTTRVDTHGEAREEAIMIRLTTADLKRVDAAADRHKVARSTYAYDQLIAGLKRQRAAAPTNDNTAILHELHDQLDVIGVPHDDDIVKRACGAVAMHKAVSDALAEANATVDDLEGKVRLYHAAFDAARVEPMDGTVGARIATLITQRDEAVLALTGLNNLTIIGSDTEPPEETSEQESTEHEASFEDDHPEAPHEDAGIAGIEETEEVETVSEPALAHVVEPAATGNDHTLS